jgi:hypothetical protein
MSDDKAILWWEKEIPRLKVAIKSLDFDLARATYGPAIRRIKEEMQIFRGELDNALRAAEVHSRAQETSAAPPKPKEFTRSPDYRSVTVRRRTYNLTARQAQIIQILHEAHEAGNPEISVAHILEEIETPNSRWQDSFKGSPGAKKALIRTGSRKGTLRLNL